MSAKQSNFSVDIFFKHSLDLFSISGFDGYLKLGNPAWETILGWSLAELSSRPLVEFIHPEDVEASTEKRKIVASDGEQFTFENRILHKDGSYRWFQWSGRSDLEDKVIISIGRDITEKKRMERLYRQERERFAMAQEFVRLGSWDLDLKTGRATWSKEMFAIYEFPEGDEPPSAEEYLKIISPEDRDDTELVIKKAISQGQGYRIRNTLRFPNNRKKIIYGICEAYRDLDGKVTKLYGVVFDITEIEKNERLLIESNSKILATADLLRQNNQALESLQQKLANILNLLPSGILQLDANGNCMYVNPNWLQLTGLKQEDLVGKGWTIAIHPEDLEQVVLRSRSLLKDSNMSEQVYRVLKPDGTVVHVQSRLLKMTDSDNQVIGYLANWLDVTSLTQTEELLQHYKMALDQASVVFFFDSKGVITYGNQKFYEMQDAQSIEELKSREVRQIKQGFSDELIFKNMWTAVRSGKSWQGELCHPNGEGSYLWTQAIVMPVLDKLQFPKLFIVIYKDITEVKESQKAIIQAAKLSSLGEMAAGVGHEVNNPLAIIQGKCLVLRRKILAGNYSPEAAVEDLEKIVGTTERIAKIVNGLKVFSRSPDDSPKLPVKLSEIIKQCMDLCYERVSSEGVQFRVIGNMDVDLFCRPSQLVQCFLNLINNSFEAVNNTKSPWIEISVFNYAEKVVIAVADSGRGIKPDVAEKMMQPFFSTKAVGKGSGLGLSLTKGIVEEHHGTFEFDSQSENTRFVIELPIWAMSESGSSKAS